MDMQKPYSIFATIFKFYSSINVYILKSFNTVPKLSLYVNFDSLGLPNNHLATGSGVRPFLRVTIVLSV